MSRAIPLWQVIATGSPDTATAVEEYFRVTEAGLTHGGFARAHAFGIIEGMADEKVGQAYLEFLLDPALAKLCLRKWKQRQASPNPWMNAALPPL